GRRCSRPAGAPKAPPGTASRAAPPGPRGRPREHAADRWVFGIGSYGIVRERGRANLQGRGFVVRGREPSERRKQSTLSLIAAEIVSERKREWGDLIPGITSRTRRAAEKFRAPRAEGGSAHDTDWR